MAPLHQRCKCVYRFTALQSSRFGAPEQARTETVRRLPCQLGGPLERDPRRSSVTGLRVNKSNQSLTGGEVGHVGADPLGEEG